MKRYLLLFCSLIFLLGLYGQNDTYEISRAKFSSDEYDEFSPVFYKNGLVFCSNRNPNPFVSYSTSGNSGVINLFYIDTTSTVKWNKAKLLSKELNTRVNDGPVTFNNKMDTVFFSRNQKYSGKMRRNAGSRNNLGVFRAIKGEKDWINVKELRYNNEWYNITMPALSPDGKKLFFVSDMPDGYGGSDIYYCQWQEGYWDRPVNLGPEINTEGNESYPYIDKSGDLLFSSDGHQGLGGKDIYYSKYTDEQGFLTPVLLDSPVNSEYNDFGIVTDSLMGSGFFSSDRNETIDIFSFTTVFPQILYSEEQRNNQKCFIFKDDGSISIDTLRFEYEWVFNDSTSVRGKVVEYCFPGPGEYKVDQRIIDISNDSSIFTKLSLSIHLNPVEQPYISGPENIVKGNPITYDGYKSRLSGYRVINCTWDFGDGEKAKGSEVTHSYLEPGEYTIKLGLTLEDLDSGAISRKGVYKKIYVYSDSLEMKNNPLSNNVVVNSQAIEIGDYDYALVKPMFSVEEILKQGAVFQTVILSSDEMIPTDSYIFNKIPDKYNIKEIRNDDLSGYTYIIDQQLTLMAIYNAYKDLLEAGYEGASIRIAVVKDPAARELNELIRIFGSSTDNLFDENRNLTSNAYLFLNNLVKLLNEYPEKNLYIGVHTDNDGTAEDKLRLSQQFARTIQKYLTERGIDEKRLDARGYGLTRPIAPNFFVEGRKLNRRIEFIISDS